MFRWTAATIMALLLAMPGAIQARTFDPAMFATRYVAAFSSVMEPGAGPTQVDALMAFYADDYTYYHPQFGAKVTGKAAVRAGAMAQLGRTTDVALDIHNIAINGDSVVLTLTERFRVVADGAVVSRPRIMVLTIKAGRIVQRVDI